MRNFDAEQGNKNSNYPLISDRNPGAADWVIFLNLGKEKRFPLYFLYMEIFFSQHKTKIYSICDDAVPLGKPSGTTISGLKSA